MSSKANLIPKGKKLFKASTFSKIYLIVILIFIYLPMLVVIVYSFNDSKTDAVWGGFTFDWYSKITKNKNLMKALKNSLQVALLSTANAVIIGTLGAVGLVNTHFKANKIIEKIATLPMMIPEIIMGMAFLTFFSLINISLGIQTLVIAHTSFCIPYILTTVKDRLVTINPSISEAARDLGASRMRLFFDITLPLILPAVISGAALAFAMSLDDVVISFFTTGPKTNTLPVMIFSQLKVGITPEINALSTIILLATFIIFATANIIQNKKQNQEK